MLCSGLTSKKPQIAKHKDQGLWCPTHLGELSLEQSGETSFHILPHKPHMSLVTCFTRTWDQGEGKRINEGRKENGNHFSVQWPNFPYS